MHVCARLCLCGIVICCHVRSWDICHKRYSAVPLRSILNQKIVKCNCTFKRRHKNIENCHNFLFVKLQLSIFISCLPDWHICHGGCSFRRRIRTKSVSCSPVDMYTHLAVFDFFCQCYTQSCVRNKDVRSLADSQCQSWWLTTHTDLTAPQWYLARYSMSPVIYTTRERESSSALIQ